jgi:tight adherence protein B
MPAALGMIIWMIAPGYMITFFRDPAGQYMLGACFMLQVLGFLWIRKVIQIKV